jgi:predicted transcriptional regulator
MYGLPGRRCCLTQVRWLGGDQMAATGDRLSLVAKIAASYLRSNSVSVNQIGALISSVGMALEQASKIGRAADEAALAASVEAARKPAVSITQSVRREYIVCLEDGKHAVILKRHLRTAHGLTPQQYREKWRLPHDYPMSAPAYSEQRSQLAMGAGLGRKTGVATEIKAKRRATDGRTGASVAAP